MHILLGETDQSLAFLVRASLPLTALERISLTRDLAVSLDDLNHQFHFKYHNLSLALLRLHLEYMESDWIVLHVIHFRDFVVFDIVCMCSCVEPSNIKRAPMFLWMGLPMSLYISNIYIIIYDYIFVYMFIYNNIYIYMIIYFLYMISLFCLFILTKVLSLCINLNSNSALSFCLYIAYTFTLRCAFPIEQPSKALIEFPLILYGETVREAHRSFRINFRHCKYSYPLRHSLFSIVPESDWCKSHFTHLLRDALFFKFNYAAYVGLFVQTKLFYSGRIANMRSVIVSIALTRFIPGSLLARFPDWL